MNLNITILIVICIFFKVGRCYAEHFLFRYFLITKELLLAPV